MTKCYLCKTEITETNATEEHIIPNAIGGRLKSSKLLCKVCNSNFGNNYDSKLAKELETFTNLLNIKRERGLVPNITMTKESTGEKFIVNPEGAPEINHPSVKIENGKIEIKAKDKKEVYKILKTIKSKRYPSLNIDEVMKNAHYINEHLSEPLTSKLVIGSNESRLAILKIVIEYYIHITNDIKSVTEAINDLKNKYTNKVEPIILGNRLFELLEGEVTHSIFIKAEGNKVYAIIEFYSTVQFIVKLSQNYIGKSFSKLYVYDVLLRKDLEKNLCFTPPTVDSIFSYSYKHSQPNFKIFEKNFSRILNVSKKRQANTLISKICKNSVQNTFGKLPEGKTIEQKDVDDLVSEIMKNLDPVLKNITEKR